MPGFFKAAMIVMSTGAIASAGVLSTVPEEARAPLFAAAPIPDPPPAPCYQQFWPNTDRACQRWTVAHRDVARLLAPESALVEEPPEPAPATGARLAAKESNLHARKPRAAHVQRVAREDNASRFFHATAQRGIVMWPTSREDSFRSRATEWRNDRTRVAFFGAQPPNASRPWTGGWRNTNGRDF
jgi:hypothetical protein